MKIFRLFVLVVVCASVVIGKSGTCNTWKWEFDESSQTLTISGSGHISRLLCEDYLALQNQVKNVVIGNGIEKIGYRMFCDWPNLVSVTIPPSVATISDDVFRNTSLKAFHIPKTLTSIAFSAFWDCHKLKSITVDNDHSKYVVDDDVVFHTGKTILAKYPAGKTLKKYTIPESVKTVGEYSFQGCDNLRSIIIPNSTTYFGKFAFNSCRNVKSYVLPGSLQMMEQFAFANSDSLSHVRYLGEKPPAFQNGIFANCPKLTEVCVEPTFRESKFCDFNISKTCAEPSSSDYSDYSESEQESSDSEGQPSGSPQQSLVSSSIMHVPSIVLVALTLFMLL